jgi:hypothetical protein
MSEEEEVVYQSKGNKKMEKLIDQFCFWRQKPIFHKSSLIC